MNTTHVFFLSILFLLLFTSACHSQDKPATTVENSPLSDPTTAIAEYLVEIFEDSKGQLWLGTLSKGVAIYDGTSLRYLTTEDGLLSNDVVSVTEDKEGHIWLGTRAGIFKYDGSPFTHFGVKEGLGNDQVAGILIDRQGNFWVGTWGGVYRFDGKHFTPFPLPTPVVDTPAYVATKDWVSAMMEDRQGNIWFARSGYGATKYDGTSFTSFTKKEGLLSNCVQAIHEDKNGNIWFGTRIAERDHPDATQRTGKGGLNRYDGGKIYSYPTVAGLNENNIYTIYEDRAGHLWISTSELGLYRYDGEQFSLFEDKEQPNFTAKLGSVQSMLEDREGTIWMGVSGGLIRLDNGSIVPVSQAGPWK